MTRGWNLDHSPAFMIMDLMSRMLSPYQLNPANINPLRDVLVKSVDFDVSSTAAPCVCSSPPPT